MVCLLFKFCCTIKLMVCLFDQILFHNKTDGVFVVQILLHNKTDGVFVCPNSVAQ